MRISTHVSDRAEVRLPSIANDFRAKYSSGGICLRLYSIT